MHALVYDGKGAMLANVPDPRPAKDEALLAVRVAGICRTDLEVLDGYMSFRGVMGHEFVGTVVAGPAGWLGKRATAEINCPCGRCDLCRRGLPNHCRDRGVLGIDRRDGVFAELVAVPVATLHAIPDSLDDHHAVLVEPLAAALQILRQVRIEPDEKVLLLGDGRLAQLIARALKALVGPLRMVGKHPSRMAAAEKQGIQTVPLADFSPAADADVVIDATGSPDGFDLAMRAVRPRGTIVLKSTFAGGQPLNLAPLVIHEITVVGSRCGPFDEAIRLLASGTIDVSALITRRLPLSRAVEALLAAKNHDNLKVLIDVSR